MVTMTNEFYTSAVRYGNNILYRGYRNGESVKERIPFKPKLYIGGKGTGWTTLDGLPVVEMQFDSMSEAKDFEKRYSGVSNVTICGNTNYVAQCITEKFPNDITFDRSLVKVLNIDIEVESSDGFHEPAYANHPVISIALRQNDGTYWVWGLDDYETTRDDVLFIKCDRSLICSRSLSSTGRCIHRTSSLGGTHASSIFRIWSTVCAR